MKNENLDPRVQEFVKQERLKETVVYRLASQYKGKTADGKDTYTPYLEITPIQTVEVDGEMLSFPYIASQKVVQNELGQKVVTGIVGEIIFEKGFLYVTPDKQALFEFLEQSDYNETNPKRNASKPIKFFRDDLKNKEEFEKANLKNKADLKSSDFLSKATAKVKRDVASQSFGIVTTGKSSEEIYLDLIAKKQQDVVSFWATIEKYLNDTTDERYSIIETAKEKGILVFDKSGEWQYVENNTKNKVAICPAGVDKDVFLEDFLANKQNLPILKKIKSLVNPEN